MNQLTLLLASDVLLLVVVLLQSLKLHQVAKVMLIPSYNRFTKSPCRVCNHYHRVWIMQNYNIGDCVHYPPYEMANCYCYCKHKDYMPLDNLEYLQWKYENKENR